MYNEFRMDGCLHSFIKFPVCVRVCISGSSDLVTAPGQGCPTPGCNGVGHIRGPRYGTHYTFVAQLFTVVFCCNSYVLHLHFHLRCFMHFPNCSPGLPQGIFVIVSQSLQCCLSILFLKYF